MTDELLADLLATLGLINKHDDIVFGMYSTKPNGKMCYTASGILELEHIAYITEKECLDRGFPVRLSKANGKYVCIVEKSWVTVENDSLVRAKIEACAKTLEGTLKSGSI